MGLMLSLAGGLPENVLFPERGSNKGFSEKKIVVSCREEQTPCYLHDPSWGKLGFQ